VADVDAAFVQQVLDVPQGKREPDVHHDRKADDLVADVEILEGVAFCHVPTLRGRPARLNWIPSDTTHDDHGGLQPRKAPETPGGMMNKATQAQPPPPMPQKTAFKSWRQKNRFSNPTSSAAC